MLAQDSRTANELFQNYTDIFLIFFYFTCRHLMLVCCCCLVFIFVRWLVELVGVEWMSRDTSSTLRPSVSQDFETR